MFNVWSDKWDTFSYAPVNVVSRSMYVLNVEEHHKVKSSICGELSINIPLCIDFWLL